MINVDVKAAFDSVPHYKLWEVLGKNGIPGDIVRTLKDSYEQVRAKVMGTNCEFIIKKGVKQGDPLSMALFNVYLNHILERVRLKWREKGWGLKIGGERVTDDEFADDICRPTSRY